MADGKEVAAAQVKSIFIYPVKSCRGISVSEAPLSSTMIRAPGMDVLKVPLVEPSEVANGVSVWEWSGSALDEGDEASNWFSKYLGKPSRLVRFNEVSESRPTDANFAPGYKIKFNDAYPFLLISQKSLDVLNEQLKEPVSINRFRPNILVDGSDPFCEDLWKDIKIGENTFGSTELCFRCKVPTINQETAEAGPEPSETLMKFRSDKVLNTNKKQQGRIYFGQNFVWVDSLAQEKRKTVKVGDPVYVLKMVSSYVDVSV
ncbi:uncharacterized protein LOC132626477 isoform X2 [Lycium barbarum]|uniref:uncharacterized protein LOC132626477 isoform X2 n=1 Tax=Lycium barbarum TaxID=112863 RepID=UPI00293F0E83|nr:uncharacterized protein LOC132626477 isoform X2 [Lycium barbarum]